MRQKVNFQLLSWGSLAGLRLLWPLSPFEGMRTSTERRDMIHPVKAVGKSIFASRIANLVRRTFSWTQWWWRPEKPQRNQRMDMNNITIHALEYWHLLLLPPPCPQHCPNFYIFSVYFSYVVIKKQSVSAFSRQRMREVKRTLFLQKLGTQNDFP